MIKEKDRHWDTLLALYRKTHQKIKDGKTKEVKKIFKHYYKDV